MRLLGCIHLNESQKTCEELYEREVDWDQGYKLNLDSRLVVLGMNRLLAHARSAFQCDLLTEGENVGLVIACGTGSLSSYQEFFESMRVNKLRPPTYTQAMPSTAAAAISICYSIQGPTIMLTNSTTGPLWKVAWDESLNLIQFEHCDTVIVGCWHIEALLADPADGLCQVTLAALKGEGDEGLGLGEVTLSGDIAVSKTAPVDFWSSLESIGIRQ